MGHSVLPQSHIGDWGTQFGMLVEQVLDEGVDVKAMDLAAAEQLYTRAATHFTTDAEFADKARRRVVLLQAGDPQTMGIWHDLVDISLAGFNDAYVRMNVRLTDDHVAGESMYNHDLAVVAAELEADGTAVIDDGRSVRLRRGFRGPDDRPEA